MSSGKKPNGVKDENGKGKSKDYEIEGNRNEGENPNCSSYPYTGIFSPGGLLSSFPDTEGTTKEINPEKISTAPDSQKIESALVRVTSTDHSHSHIQGHDSDLLPSEIAFAIDHILEKILHSLDLHDLLTSRLVCYRWLLFVQSKLEERVKISFSDNNLGWTYTNFDAFNKPALCELTLLLKQKQKQNQSPDENLNLEESFKQIPFPCTKFALYNSNLTCEKLQTFLHTYGEHIHHLELESETESSLNERVALKHINILLSSQLPNIKFLSLHLNTNVEWKRMDHNNRSENCNTTLLQSDPEFEEIHHLCSVNVNSSLKTLQVGCVPSAKILEAGIALAPNLEEVIVDKSSYAFLIEPVNRIHLLKSLQLDPMYVSIDVLEKIACASSANQKQNLKLKEIFLYHWDRWRSCFGTNQEHRFVFVFNQIFASSWDSLESIEWHEVTFDRGMKWPQVMPNVHTLTMGVPGDLYEMKLKHDHFHDPSNQPPKLTSDFSIFPLGFDLSTIFPRLRTVFLYDKEGQDNLVHFLQYLNAYKLPVSTVKSVHVSNSGETETCLEALVLIKELFPDATVDNCYE